jgi:hypothetical protein
MTDIAIQNLKSNISFFENKWRLNYTLDYVEAYWKACDAFEEFKTAQDKVDQTLLQFKLDLAVAALTICSGSVLGVVLGEMTIAETAGKVALDALCRANMNDIFTKAKLSSATKVLEFSVGGIWQEIKKIAALEAKNILGNESIGASVGQSFIQKGHTKAYIIEKFLTKNVLNLETACDTLKDSIISAQKKEQMFNELKQSHFCNPPTQKVLPAKYHEWIELTFYLKLVLNSDWLEIKKRDSTGFFIAGHSRTPIDVPPDDPNYPISSFKYGQSRSTTNTRVEYDRVGQVYIDRMNTLYRKLLPGDYNPLINSSRFGETTSKQILEKAYRTLKMIGDFNRKLILFPNNN